MAKLLCWLFLGVHFVFLAMVGSRYENTAIPVWFFWLIGFIFVCAHIYFYSYRRIVLPSPLLSAVSGPVWLDHLLNLSLVGLFGRTLWLSLAFVNGAL